MPPRSVEALGYVVGSRALGTALWSAVDGAENVTVHCPATVASAEVGESQVVVTLDDGAVLRSRLLVVADGARSGLRTALGIAARVRPYEQVAIVGSVARGRAGRRRAGVRALHARRSAGPAAHR